MSIPATILTGILRLFGFLPLKVHYAFGSFTAWLAENIVRYRVNDVTVNLSRSFPELKYKEIKRLRHAYYRHFGEIIAETIWFGACRTPERLRKSHLVEISNPDVITRLSEVSGSTMVMYSHTGNWELIGGILNYNYTGTPDPMTEQNVVVVYKGLSSKVWGEFFKDNRCAPLLDRKHFEGYIESNDILRYALRNKEEKKFYHFITDQSPYRNAKGTVDVNFMGQPTKAMTGAAVLARKLNMSVAYLSMVRESRGHYKFEYRTICEDASTMSAEDITKRYYELLEKDIKAQPENYLWSHRRWKIRMQKEKKTVLTFGVYDLTHIGHIQLFKRAKALGDRLVVAVQRDECILKYKPEAELVYDTESRKTMVMSCMYVDSVVEYSDVDTDIRNIDFDILVVGPDQNHEGFRKAIQWCGENGREVVELPRTEGISSSLLRKGTNS